MKMESIKLLRIHDVSKKTTLAKSTIWLKLSQGVFPKPFKIASSINVWKESDIDAWINSLANQQTEVRNG
jgi:prophage regulatory protein